MAAVNGSSNSNGNGSRRSELQSLVHADVSDRYFYTGSERGHN